MEVQAKRRADKYGISELDLELMYKRQQHRCAICGVHENESPNKKLHIDHCHEGGNVRALLCHHCNVGLGHFKDNPKYLERALEYVRQYEYTKEDWEAKEGEESSREA